MIWNVFFTDKIQSELFKVICHIVNEKSKSYFFRTNERFDIHLKLKQYMN